MLERDVIFMIDQDGKIDKMFASSIYEVTQDQLRDLMHVEELGDRVALGMLISNVRTAKSLAWKRFKERGLYLGVVTPQVLAAQCQFALMLAMADGVSF